MKKEWVSGESAPDAPEMSGYGAGRESSSAPSDVAGHRTRSSHLRALKRLNAILHQPTGFRETVQRIRRHVPECLGVSRVTVMVLEEQEPGKPLLINADDTDLGSLKQDARASVSGAAVTLGEPVVVNNCLETDLIPAEAVELFHLRSTVALPLYAGDRTIGVMRLDDTVHTNRFTPEDVEFLRVVAELVGLALENARLVDERTRVQEDLEAERNFCGAVIEGVGTLVVVLDAEGKIVRFNHACEKLSGFSASEVLGTRISDSLVPPEESVPFHSQLLAMISGEEQLLQCETSWQTKAGERRLIAWSFTTLSSQAGGGLYAIASGTDITEVRQAEREQEIFARLGLELAVAATVSQVAHVLRRAIEDLWEWDSFYLSIRRSGKVLMRPVLEVDTLDGVKQELPTTAFEDVSYMGTSPLGRGEAILINRNPGDMGTMPRFGDTGRPSASLLYAPIRVVDEVIGVCSVQSYEFYKFGEADRELLRKIGDIAGPALARCQVEQRSAAFASLGRRLSAARGPEAAAQIVAEVADELLGWDACVMNLYSKADGLVRPLVTMDIVDGARKSAPLVPYPLEDGMLTARAMREGAQLILRRPEVESEKGRPFGNYSRRSASLMFAPVCGSAGAIGVLSIQSYHYDAYDEKDLLVLQALADHCAGALERTENEEALRTREERYRSIIACAGAVPYQLDYAAKRYLFIGEGILQMTGFAPEEFSPALLQQMTLDVAPRSEHSGMTTEQARELAIQGKLKTWQADIRIRTRTGHERWLSDSSMVLCDTNGVPIGSLGILQDITERKQAEQALQESEQRYALAVQGSNDGLWDWDLRSVSVYYSPRWKAILGFDASELTHDPQEWVGRIHPDDVQRFQRKLRQHLQGHVPHFEIEHRIRPRTGDYIWVLARGVAVRDSQGEAYRIAGSLADVTARKSAEEQLVHGAYHDALTGLPNRAHFQETLTRLLARARRRPAYRFAVLFLDLDRFKVINDSLGHLTGDRLLVAISQRLEQLLRPGDMVARLGGDEFTVLLDDISETSDATRVANRILEELSRPFCIDNREIYTSASIGIAVGTSDYSSPEELLRDSDTAMYRAKEAGKARSAIFDIGMHTVAMERLRLETDLRRALDAAESFRLHYQPIISNRTGELSGVEALLRWQYSPSELVPPGKFIPIAEETGLIIPLGWWVLDEACRQLRHWQDRCGPDRRLTMSVNLSVAQLRQARFLDSVEALLQEYRLAPSTLALEVTESQLMGDAESLVGLLSELKKLGVEIHVDDFGTGYSSLAYLHRFPIDVLKIDRSFVSRMNSGESTSEIVRAVIDLGHSMNMKVVAEGVETPDQLELVRGYGCDFSQGYLMCRPVPEPQITSLLSSGRTWDWR